MAASIWRYIRADLRRILLTVPGLPDVKWEGKRYRPTLGVAYLAERIQPGASITETLGGAGQTQETGIYMLDPYWPASGSVSDLEDLADAIRLTFWHGRGIGSSGPDQIVGSVLASERLRLVEGDSWFEAPVRIEFFVRRFTRQAA